MPIGDRIKDLRIAHNMTQTDLADKIGTTKQNVSRYEKGEIKDIPMKQLQKIADVFDTTPAFLLFGRNSGLVAFEDDRYNPFYDEHNDAFGDDWEWRKRHGAIDEKPVLQQIVDMIRDCDEQTLERIAAVVKAIIK